MLRFSLSLPIESAFVKADMTADIDGLSKYIKKALELKEGEIQSLSPFKRSLDARKGRPFLYVWTVDITLSDKAREKHLADKHPNTQFIDKEDIFVFPFSTCASKQRPVIVGFGPSGIFCALMLARAGANPIVLERGGTVEERTRAVESFFTAGILDENNNIQFGEGGAGTFSDGKLNTLVKDKTFRGYYVLKELVKAGAPDEILYLNKPHIGTDRLREVVVGLRREIISLGGEVLFNTRLTDVIIENGVVTGAVCEDKTKGTKREIKTDTLFLAAGHSAIDVFAMLDSRKVPLERKPFSVGVRIEHLQSEIDKTQYRGYAGSPYLPAADYKIVCHTKNGRALYSFCMCPGGIVVAASSENGGVVTNGMSYHARDGINANSALLVTVGPQDLPDNSLFAGVGLQRTIEKKAFLLGGGSYKAPCQCVGDFLERKPSTSFGIIKPSYPLGVTPCDLNKLLPSFITDTLRDGIMGLEKLLKGFSAPEAVLTAPESRSTSPLRIIRGEDMQSVIKGLYPIGEGAGYAGGIMSASIDGVKAAECYLSSKNK
ncbi:MAG: hypothetical protein CVU97_05660 [Firmicutes bacterium HGW-Firmicutes-21]|nr:MAG: hypothetical protein CVU97_05660 [Firmicutes bacterium HGW-Firmicutes-21]